MRIIGGMKRGTKLFSLEGENTRPTLDRVKESLFNIINFNLQDSIILDLFSGSGSLGLESISRGASKAVLCDSSKEACNIIKKNIEKLKYENETKLYNLDYKDCLKKLKEEGCSFNFIFIDPPYELDYYKYSLELIDEYNLLSNDGIVILETDDIERIEKYIDTNRYNVFDRRKYGRANLVFLNRKE